MANAIDHGNFWPSRKSDIMNMVHDFFDSGVISALLNESYIFLISKKIESKLTY